MRRWASTRSGLRHVFGETVEAARPAALMRVARRHRLEDGLTHGEPRLSTVLGEGYRHQRFVAGLALRILPGPREDEPHRLHDLAIDAPQPMVGALGRAHAEAIDAARADVHRAGWDREAFRAPPARKVLRLGPNLEHEAGWRIQDARDDEYLLRRFRGGTTSCDHVSSPSFGTRADSRPSDRGSVPRNGDS